ncbi:MAG: T9SS type A sorting domain-containing protein [Bacteroidota bacterium]
MNTKISSAQTFGPPQINPFGLTNTNNSFPTFVDIDSDGDYDAFVGEYYGLIKYFKNNGNNTNPSFAAPQTNPFGLASAFYLAAPSFADIDDDGDLDAFIGEGYGAIRYFENTGNNTAPAFASPQVNPFGLTNTDYYAFPTHTDIDSDGDYDIFVGEYYGAIKYFENTGSSTSPAFASQQTNPFGLTNVAGYISTPSFVDIDCDGDFDAFIGGEDYGSITYFENTGSNTAPSFAPATSNPFGIKSTGGFAAPSFADIDGDGDFDLFIGNYNGSIIYYENTTTPDCPSPISLSADNISLNTADLSWASTNPGTAYTLEYGPSGFTPGSGITLAGTSATGVNSQSISGLNATTLYEFYIQEDCGSGNYSDNVGPLLFATSPANDNCIGAIPVNCGDIFYGSTVSATTDTPDSCGTTNGTGGGVWFSFTGTGDTINASLCNSNYDTKIRVYTGTCGSLVCITGIDDTCGLQSEVEWLSLMDTTYYILVHGYGDEEGFFTLNMCNAISSINESIPELNFNIYPNPVSQNFNIEIRGKRNLNSSTLEIYNTIGQIMLREKLRGWSNKYHKEISTDGFTKGIYFVRLISEDYIVVRKLIIQ